MEPYSVYLPSRKRGLILHITAAAVLLVSGGGLFWFALQQEVGTSFLLLISLSVILVVPVAVIAYRGYALTKASYILERDGLHLSWGLRTEDIPLYDVEWVRPANELGFRLPLPPLSWPGAILGTQSIDGLGAVDYIASDANNLLVIATPQKVFVISPEDSRGFLGAFQRTIEMGSLTHIEAQSTRPGAYLQTVWSDRTVRILALTGLGLTIALFLIVTLLIPGRGSISLGFDIQGHPVDPGPAARLLLLPVLCAFTYVGDIIVGLFIYRWEDQRAVAYMLLGGTILTPILLIIAALLLI